jgi:hypothetical protein
VNKKRARDAHSGKENQALHADGTKTEEWQVI